MIKTLSALIQLGLYSKKDLKEKFFQVFCYFIIIQMQKLHHCPL